MNWSCIGESIAYNGKLVWTKQLWVGEKQFGWAEMACYLQHSISIKLVSAIVLLMNWNTNLWLLAMNPANLDSMFFISLSFLPSGLTSMRSSNPDSQLTIRRFGCCFRTGKGRFNLLFFQLSDLISSQTVPYYSIHCLKSLVLQQGNFKQSKMN